MDLYWALPYVGLVNDETWIIAGQVETFTTNEGEQSRLLMIDLKFTEDKISMDNCLREGKLFSRII